MKALAVPIYEPGLARDYGLLLLDSKSIVLYFYNLRNRFNIWIITALILNPGTGYLAYVLTQNDLISFAIAFTGPFSIYMYITFDRPAIIKYIQFRTEEINDGLLDARDDRFKRLFIDWKDIESLEVELHKDATLNITTKSGDKYRYNIYANNSEAHRWAERINNFSAKYLKRDF